MFNYDEVDYEEEKERFIIEAQQKVWDLFMERLNEDNLMNKPEMELEAARIVEDWTGHPFQLDIELPPRPTDNVPY